MRSEDLGRSVLFVERAHRQIFDETCPVDAAQNLIAFVIRAKGRPATFHVAQPEDIRAFDNHAVGPDLDPAINLDRLRHDEPVDDADGKQTDEIEPKAVKRRMMKQIPAFAAGCRRPGKDAPKYMTDAQVEILVGKEDAALWREEPAVIDIGVRLESGPG